MERLEYIESVEDYLILKEQIEELNNCYKDLYNSTFAHKTKLFFSIKP